MSRSGRCALPQRGGGPRGELAETVAWLTRCSSDTSCRVDEVLERRECLFDAMDVSERRTPCSIVFAFPETKRRRRR